MILPESQLAAAHKKIRECQDAIGEFFRFSRDEIKKVRPYGDKREIAYQVINPIFDIETIEELLEQLKDLEELKKIVKLND